LDGHTPIADESTHISENNGLSASRKRATLCKGEPGIGVVVDPDLEGFLTMTVIADEEYICETPSTRATNHN
jgi:hypothetical protein